MAPLKYAVSLTFAILNIRDQITASLSVHLHFF